MIYTGYGGHRDNCSATAGGDHIYMSICAACSFGVKSSKLTSMITVADLAKILETLKSCSKKVSEF